MTYTNLRKSVHCAVSLVFHVTPAILLQRHRQAVSWVLRKRFARRNALLSASRKQTPREPLVKKTKQNQTRIYDGALPPSTSVSLPETPASGLRRSITLQTPWTQIIERKKKNEKKRKRRINKPNDYGRWTQCFSERLWSSSFRVKNNRKSEKKWRWLPNRKQK